MLHHTFHESVTVGTAMLPQTITAAAAVNGSTISIASGGDCISFLVQTTNIATDEVATIKFEETADLSTWTKIKDNDTPANDLSFTIPNAGTGDENTTIASVPFTKIATGSKWVRMVVTSAGTTINYNIAASFVISGYASRPTATNDEVYAKCVSFV